MDVEHKALLLGALFLIVSCFFFCYEHKILIHNILLTRILCFLKLQKVHQIKQIKDTDSFILMVYSIQLLSVGLVFYI